MGDVMGNVIRIALDGTDNALIEKIKNSLNEKYSNQNVTADFQECYIFNSLIDFWNNYECVLIIGNDCSLNVKKLQKWIGHPHLRCIDGENFEQINENVFNEIDCILSNIELEKKFLIEYPDFEKLNKYNPFKAEIEQVYLVSDVGSHRIRKRGAKNSYSYFETVKIRINGSKCHEFENIISEYDYKELLKLADAKYSVIKKDRYCFVYNSQYFELDVYPFWNDKAILELELKNEKQSFVLPPEIKVIKDVSDNKKYKNKYLASLNL